MMKLQSGGVVSGSQTGSLRQLISDDIELPQLLKESPQPPVHYVVAVSFFERITARTPDSFLQEWSYVKQNLVFLPWNKHKSP